MYHKSDHFLAQEEQELGFLEKISLSPQSSEALSPVSPGGLEFAFELTIILMEIFKDACMVAFL